MSKINPTSYDICLPLKECGDEVSPVFVSKETPSAAVCLFHPAAKPNNDRDEWLIAAATFQAGFCACLEELEALDPRFSDKDFLADEIEAAQKKYKKKYSADFEAATLAIFP